MSKDLKNDKNVQNCMEAISNYEIQVLIHWLESSGGSGLSCTWGKILISVPPLSPTKFSGQILHVFIGTCRLLETHPKSEARFVQMKSEKTR